MIEMTKKNQSCRSQSLSMHLVNGGRPCIEFPIIPSLRPLYQPSKKPISRPFSGEESRSIIDRENSDLLPTEAGCGSSQTTLDGGANDQGRACGGGGCA